MRISRVTGHAFGHLREQALELADGLTVVYGRNEAGKSTWHAALLAALCGRWPSRARDEPGIERRRPWVGSEWVVSAEVRLADGRRVELRHDLEARHGYAKDLDIGTDHSREITGSARGEVPDASRWLGLDRRAFVATACVRQAHLVLATEDASGVRSYVERAASTAPADETAAAALARIDTFQREQVGTERSTTRPLPVAQRRRMEAEEALQAARASLIELEQAATTANRLRAEADVSLARLRRAEAAQARTEAQRLRTRATQARELVEAGAGPIVPVGGPARGRSGSVATTSVSAAEVAAAVEAWRTTVAIVQPTPPSPIDAPPAAPNHRRRSALLLATAALLAVGAIVLFVAGETVLGVGTAVVALLAAAGGLKIRPGGQGSESSPIPDRSGLAERLVSAERRVLMFAGELGISSERGPEAVRQLETWLAADGDRQAARERAAAAQARLEALLDGASLAELDAAAERAQRRADTFSVPDDDGSTVDDPAALELLRQEHQEADRRAEVASRVVEARQAEQVSVAEAEERLAAAEAECRRLLALDDVLTRTRQFLARAQERVHRDIAPHLAATVARDLAMVTAGRYTEAVVDPGSLAVQVRGAGAPLRDVAELSTGTVEQVYLLLRVALAERLVRPGESCPLLLDDVTVHADQERTRRILDVLLTVAERHQVVLFTQQEQVREWARDTLTDPRHALREVTTLAPA